MFPSEVGTVDCIEADIPPRSHYDVMCPLSSTGQLEGEMQTAVSFHIRNLNVTGMNVGHSFEIFLRTVGSLELFNDSLDGRVRVCAGHMQQSLEPLPS